MSRTAARHVVFALSTLLILDERASPTLAQQSQTFSPGPSLGEPRSNHTATLLSDGRTLIAGGNNGGGVLGTAQLLDPVSRQVTSTGSLLTPRTRHTATLLKDGRVLIAGGEAPSVTGGPLRTLDSAEIYDPSSGRFTSTGTLTSARVNHSAVLLANGNVLICGGTGGALPNGAITVLRTVESYDPQTGRFTPAASMTIQRVGHTATLLDSGQVLIVADGFAEIYDPTTNRFVRTPGSPTPRLGHTATLLRDGQVLLVGGVFQNGTLATAELYDSRTGVFRSTASLAVPRTRHTATRLEDGRVLIAGGQQTASTTLADGKVGSNVTRTNTVEIYDPASGTFASAGSMMAARAAHAAVPFQGGVWITGGAGNTSEMGLTTAPPEVQRPSSTSRGNRVDAARPDERRYTNRTRGWSIAYAENWKVDDRDEDFVKIKGSSSEQDGLLGIHSATFDRQGVPMDDFVESLMASERRRPGFRILSRTPTTLPDGTPALEVINVLGVNTVGKSRKVFVIVGARGFCLDAETYLDAWPALEASFDRMLSSFKPSEPSWQEELETARRLASSGNVYTLATARGVAVFYNNPQPICYTYAIPGDWIVAPEPSAHRSRDGRSFAGVLVVLRRDLERVPGRTLVERDLNSITRRYEQGVGQRLTIQTVPFESSRPGTWKWSATPLRQPDREIAFPSKIVVELGSAAVAEMTITGMSDNDDLARRIIETFKTQTNRQCYWTELEGLLKSSR